MTNKTVEAQIPVWPWGDHGCPRTVTVRIRGQQVDCISVSQEPCGTCERETVEGDALWVGALLSAVRWHVEHGSCGQSDCPICEDAEWSEVA